MWALLPRRLQVGVIAVAAALLVWGLEGAWEWASGAETTPLKFVSLVAFLIGSVLAAIANFVWRPIWRCFPRIEGKTFPDLTGTWEGDLITTWKDPVTGQSPAPIPTRVYIRQSLLMTSVQLRTGESRSHSTRCTLEADHGAQVFRIWYSYDNRPRAGLSYRSLRHEGVAWLEMDLNADRDRLSGQYYTDRRTTGDMVLRRTSRSIKKDIKARASVSDASRDALPR